MEFCEMTFFPRRLKNSKKLPYEKKKEKESELLSHVMKYVQIDGLKMQ